MSNKSQHEVVKRFIVELKTKYSEINIEYCYSEEDDIFDIWHDSKELQFEDKDFMKCVGVLLKDFLYSKGVYNISFGYDYARATLGTKNYTVQKGLLIDTCPIIKVSSDAELKGFLYSTSNIIKKESFFELGNNTRVFYYKEDISKYDRNYSPIEKYVDESKSYFENLNTWEEELVA